MCLKENYVHITIAIMYIYRYISIYIFPSSSFINKPSKVNPNGTGEAGCRFLQPTLSSHWQVFSFMSKYIVLITPYSSLSGWWFLTHSRNMSHLNQSSLLYPFVWLKKQYITYWTTPTILPWNLYGTAMVQPKTIVVSRSWWTYRLEPRKSDIAGWAIP